MNLGNYTIKAAEIVQQAQQLAFNAQSPSIEPSHILKALIEAAETPIEYLLKKNNVTRTIVANKLEELLATLPRVKGEAAQQISREANTLLLRAGACLQTFNDQFVTPEHLLLALVQGEDAVGKLLKNAGLTESGLVTAIKELRKGESVTSSTQSQQFNALSKYAKNLNDLARQGKLDPVIGRDEEIRRTLHILSRRTKNNPILVGEPGVGKTAIAEGIAHRTINGDVPENYDGSILDKGRGRKGEGANLCPNP